MAEAVISRSVRIPLNEPGHPLLDTFQASDGYRFYYRHYPANVERGAAQGRVVIIHGIQSHGGWYMRTHAAIAAAGFDVFVIDRRGCGLNTAHRGDAPSFRRLLDDIAEFIHALPTIATPLSEGRDIRPALIAISWGAKLGVGLQYRHPGLVSRLALLCPGFFPSVSPSLGTRIAIGRNRWRDPKRMFPIPLNAPELFTETPQWQEFIANDRYALREATARLLVESILLDIYIRRAWKHVRVPTLLQLGGADRIINSKQTREIVARTLAHCTIQEYPGAHHTLEFEPEPLPHLSDLIHWLNADEPV